MTALIQSYSIDRRIEIDSAHRVPLHGSKCANIHGHRYVIEALCKADYLADSGEQQGMVLDFSFLKEEMMNQIHNPCDHACILAYNDPMLMSIFDPSILVTIVDGVRAHGSVQIVSEFWKVYVIEGPPTAEVLAEHWFHRLQDRIDIRSEGRARLDAIRVHETPNCSAVFAPRRPKAYKKVDPTELVHAEDLGLKEESVS